MRAHTKRLIWGVLLDQIVTFKAKNAIFYDVSICLTILPAHPLLSFLLPPLPFTCSFSWLRIFSHTDLKAGLTEFLPVTPSASLPPTLPSLRSLPLSPPSRDLKYNYLRNILICLFAVLRLYLALSFPHDSTIFQNP